MDVVRAVLVLAHPHAGEGGDAVGLGDRVGCLSNRLLLDAGEFGVLGDVHVREVFFEGFEAFGALRDEFLVVNFLLDDDFRHRVEDRDVIPGRDTDVLVGLSRRLVFTRIHVDHFGAIPERGPEIRVENDRVLLGGIGPTDQEHVGFAQVVGRVRHRADVELFAHRGDSRGVTESGAVVDRVGPDLAGDLLEEVVLLVRTVRRGEKAQCFGAMFFDDLREVLDDAIIGLLPGGGNQMAVLPDHRLGESIVCIEHLEPGDALRTELATGVDWSIPAGAFAAVFVIRESTADPTEGADGLFRLQFRVGG